MHKLFLMISGIIAFMSPITLKAESLTVYPDAPGTSTYLPLNIWYCSNDIHCQMIYPATELESLIGKEISRLTFTITRSGSEWISPAVNVRMGQTTQSEYPSTNYITEGLVDVATLTDIRFEGYAQTPMTWEIDLDEPYVYTGDNLILDFTNSKGNGPRNWTFAGLTQNSVTALSMSSNVRQEKFLPTVTIEYGDPSPVGVSVSTSAVTFPMSWTGDPQATTLKLTNTGSEPLSGSASVDNDCFVITPTEFNALEGGDVQEFTLTLDTDEPGIYEGVATFIINGSIIKTVTLTAHTVAGPEHLRIMFNDKNYNLDLPEGWSGYAEEYVTTTGMFSDATTDYNDFETTLRFESATINGIDALRWNHGNPMPSTDMYNQYFYLVSPEVGKQFTMGGTLCDVAATGAFIKVYAATYNSANNYYDIDDEIDLIWDKPLTYNQWSNASAQIPEQTQLLILMKYAAISYFAADDKNSGVEYVTPAGNDCEPVYYNLQGIRIAHPVNGMPYIEQRGDIINKVVYNR